MAAQTTNYQTTWQKLWQPFFRLSVYQKFLFVLASFLLGYLAIGIHGFFFIQVLKGELLQLDIQPELLATPLEIVNRYLLHGGILVIVVMIFMSLTSFLCVHALVGFLDKMICSLQNLLSRNDTTKACAHGTTIPVITDDKLGDVATLVNALTTHIRDLSLFRRTIEADETVEEVHNRLAYVFQNTLKIEAFVIWEVREKDDSIEAVYNWPSEIEHESCTMSSANICRARRTGEIISSSGFPNICPVFSLSDIMTHTCVPMIVSGRVLGVVQFLSLFVDSPLRAMELEKNIHLASLYLKEALPVLHSKRLASNLQEMATKDALTGLCNRRFLETNINPILAGIKRRQTTMGILMCDLDFFKKVNDEYGHDVGDQILKTLALIMQNSVRASDIVIRYGGEEFLILLTECEIEKAIDVAEKIRAAVEEQLFRVENLSIRKTLSIGVSVFPVDGEAFWECVKYADIALYKAKEAGRNKVLRFDSTMWDSDNY